MRLLNDASSSLDGAASSDSSGDDSSGTNALVAAVAACISFFVIVWIVALCAGSSSTTNNAQAEETQSRDSTSNMRRGTSASVKQNSAPTEASLQTDESAKQQRPQEPQQASVGPDVTLPTLSSHAGSFTQSTIAPQRQSETEVFRPRCDIELEGDSVQEVVKLLHRICDEMSGMVGPSHHIHKDSIREGINTAVAEVTSLGVTSTAMFFPDKRRYNRQMKMYRKQWVCDFMPNVNMCNDGAEFRYGDKSALLPAHIMVDRCTTIAEAMAQCQDDKQVSVEVFLVCIQLYYQISAFHIRKKVIRDLCRTNVVQTLTGTQRRWTLLEYCSTVASGTESSHVPLHMTTPELAGPRMMNEPLRIDRPFDIWQLGVLVYETVHGVPYWQPEQTEAAILHTLASKDVSLPHESRPLRLDNVQEMLGLMLSRDPNNRPKHDGLKVVLEDHDKSGTVGVWSNHPSFPGGGMQQVGTVDLPL